MGQPGLACSPWPWSSSGGQSCRRAGPDGSRPGQAMPRKPLLWPWIGLCCRLRQASAPLWDQNDVWWEVPPAAPISSAYSSSLSSLQLLASLDRDFQQSPGEGWDRFWVVSGRGQDSPGCCHGDD